MVQAIVLTCPQCGAQLPAIAQGTVRCGYCGAEARVVGGTVVRERVPVPQVSTPSTTSTRGPFKWSWFYFVAPTLVGVLVLGYNHRRAIEAAMDPSTVHEDAAVPIAPPRWTGAHLTLVDINGDGTLDVLGEADAPTGETFIVALEGETGRVLWQEGSRARGSFSLFVIQKVVVVASEDGTLEWFDLETGRPSPLARTPEKVDMICERDGSAELWVRLHDKRTLRLDPARGVLEEAPFEGGCSREAVRGGVHPRAGAGRYTHRPDLLLPRELMEGMAVNSEVRTDARTVVAIGNKQPGTSIPMVGVVELPAEVPALEQAQADARAKERAAKGMAWHGAVRAKYRAEDRLKKALRTSTIRWVQVVPPGNPLDAETGDPWVWAVGDAIVFAGHATQAGERHVVAFDASDGRRLWSYAVSGGSSYGAHHVAVSGDRIFLGHHGRLDALAEDGSVRWSFGVTQ